MESDYMEVEKCCHGFGTIWHAKEPIESRSSSSDGFEHEIVL